MKLNSISLFQPLESTISVQQLNVSSTWLLDTQSSNFQPDREERQKSRAELESILRSARKPTPLSDQTQLSVPSELASVSLASSPSKSQFPPKAIARAEQSSEVKNERGLRSAHIQSGQTGSELARLIGAKQAKPLLASLNLNSTSVTLSQTELLNLLTLAAKNERDQMKANISLSQFKSSLPKRMTAFRQSKSAILATKQPVRVLITHEGPSLSTSTSSSSATPTSTPTPTSAPVEEPTEVARPPPDERRGRGSPTAEKKGRAETAEPSGANRTRESSVAPNSTERPFPSVDSDPPTRTSSPVELESASASSVDAKEADEEGEDSDNSEGAEVDLDALLPEVPNYNETSSRDEEPARLRLLGEKPKGGVAKAVEREKAATEAEKALREDALAFNEAASVLNVSVIREPPKGSESGAAPMKEALVMAAEERSEPSFADFLLPIVHQYHILIIAILFNMWLDSLRTKADLGGAQWEPKQSAAAHKPPSGSASELETESASSSSKALIAIPIARNNSKFRCRFERATNAEPKYALPSAERAQTHKSADRWRLSGAKKQKSRSMDLLCLQQQQQHQQLHQHQHQQLHQQQAQLTEEEASNASSLSRYNSLRSSSSEQLLFMSSSQARKESNRKQWAYSTRSSSSLNTHLSESPPTGRQHLWPQMRTRMQVKEEEPTNAVCAIFFGLLVVSGSLIVILLDVSLLSMLSQCLTQLIAILVCLLGLVLIWRASAPPERRADAPELEPSHRQCFHYLFLLAAYFCGISIALNLGRQHSAGQLFSQQVIHFLQRQLAEQPSADEQPLATANYLLLFHSLLAIKGLLLILQVTLQTLLIHSSCQRATRELRQIYTFLMFANLSLWAMEICEQQQHLHLHLQPRSEAASNELQFAFVSLDSFSKFAASIVTLSHLYHGLVFMQH